MSILFQFIDKNCRNDIITKGLVKVAGYIGIGRYVQINIIMSARCIKVM